MLTQRKPFMRHPLMWTFLITAALAAGLFSYKYFSTALPFVDIKITMNKTEALAKAGEIAATSKLGPQEYSQTAYFNVDQETQNFIELERGGAQAWRELIKEGSYVPYTWVVRHFKEGDPHELYVYFTPEGKPYGFTEVIPETAPGGALSAEDAKKKAEEQAQAWGVDIRSYKLKDSKNEKRAHGRVDHTFTYEKELPNLGDAHYHLTLVVTGDKVTALTHTIDIPEAFTRSFRSIRSFNDTLYSFALILVYIFYLFLGCLLGILYLLKKNWLLPKQAVIAGIALATLQLFAGLSELPLAWFGYDTALSAQTFLFQHLLALIVSFIGWASIYTITFMAAEGLTRRAFGGHIQLWSALKTHVASSYTMLGTILFSYAFIAFQMAFVVLFYAVGIHYWGWWTPSSSLTDPNVLSTYVPALTAISHSVTAGFWEECLFRAVPLSICALIGRRFGSRNAGIAIGFVLQALIFGAAHANYPALPFYARFFELIIPSFGFAAVYLLLGLIPSIIAHSTYNIILSSIPLFISQSQGIWIQRLIIILFCALPLIIVLANRLKAKKWLEVHHAFFNGAWQPVTTTFAFEKLDLSGVKGASRPWSFLACGAIALAGLLGFAGWALSTRFKTFAPPLSITRQQAIDVAHAALKEKNVELDPSWSILPNMYAPENNAGLGLQHLYVWQLDGQQKKPVASPAYHETYKRLMGTYLIPPQWNIRFARFSGDLTARAEEYQMLINGNGKVTRFKHMLPQTTAMPASNEQAARAQATEFIQRQYELAPQDIKEITAQSQTLPNRTDRYFIYSQPSVLPNDAARIIVSLAGNSVIDSERTVHVPEEWLRVQKKKAVLTECLGTMRWVAWLILLIIGSAFAMAFWRRDQRFQKHVLVATGIYLAIAVIGSILNLPQTISGFTTAQPLANQLAMFLGLDFLRNVFDGAILGVLTAVIMSFRVSTALSCVQIILGGLSAGLLWTAALTIIQLWCYPSVSWIPTLTGLNASIPAAAFLIRYGLAYFKQTVILQFLALCAGQRKYQALFCLILSVFLFTPYDNAANLGQWVCAVLLMACAVSCIYVFILKANPKMVPIMSAVPFVLTLCREMYANFFIGSTFILGFTALGILTLAFLLISLFGTKKEVEPEHQ